MWLVYSFFWELRRRWWVVFFTLWDVKDEFSFKLDCLLFQWQQLKPNLFLLLKYNYFFYFTPNYSIAYYFRCRNRLSWWTILFQIYPVADFKRVEPEPITIFSHKRKLSFLTRYFGIHLREDFKREEPKEHIMFYHKRYLPWWRLKLIWWFGSIFEENFTREDDYYDIFCSPVRFFYDQKNLRNKLIFWWEWWFCTVG